MKDRKLAFRYARALLAILHDPAAATAADGFLTGLARAVETDPALRSAMLDPATPRAARKQALRALVRQRGLPDELGRFLCTLVDNNRIPALDSIAEVFHDELGSRMGIVPAHMTTATPLSGAMQDRARAAFERLTGSKVRLTCDVETGLIGGAITRIGSKVYDGSLRSQLQQLRRKMAGR